MKNTNKLVLSVLAVCIGFSGHALASKGGYSDPPYEKSKGKQKGYEKNKHQGYEKKKHKGRYFKSYKDWYEYHYGKYEPYEEGTEKRLALNLVGKGPMYIYDVPDYTGDKQPDPAFCFDVNLKTIADGELIGTATDCLSMINNGPNGGSVLIGTTFFNLPDGQIVTRGITTVQEVNAKTVTPDGYDITHITGASSDKNGVIKATGAYEWYRGPVRLSGMVNLSKFGGGEGDPIFFDCMFTMDLMKINTKYPYWYKWYKEHFERDYYGEYYGHSSYDDSSQEPYTPPYKDPYDDSHDSGYEEPHDDSYDSGYEEPHDDSYDSGYEEPDDDSYGNDYEESHEDPYEEPKDSYESSSGYY